MLVPGLDKTMTRPAQSFVLAALTTLVTSTIATAETAPQPPKGSFTPYPTLNIQVDPNLTNVNKADYVLGPGDQLQICMAKPTYLLGHLPCWLMEPLVFPLSVASL
jgi:hypothetical protein